MLRTLCLAALLALVVVAPARATDPQPAEKVSIDRFEELRKEKGVVVLDVRSPEEYEEGHVPGATNVNVQDKSFADRVKQLDRDKTYVVYCQSGARSARAAAKMKELGIAKLFNFPGSMNEWSASGKPVEKGAGNDEKPEGEKK